MSDLDLNTWSHFNTKPNNNGGNAVRGRDVLITHLHIDDLLTVSGTT